MINAGFAAIKNEDVVDYPSLIIKIKENIKEELIKYYKVFGLIER